VRRQINIKLARRSTPCVGPLRSTLYLRTRSVPRQQGSINTGPRCLNESLRLQHVVFELLHVQEPQRDVAIQTSRRATVESVGFTDGRPKQ